MGRLGRFLRRGAGYAVSSAADWFAPVLAPIVSYMARTGTGTDACLRRNCLPLPVDFHSPVPDLTDLEERGVWDRRSDLSGVDFRVGAQVALLSRLGGEYGYECDWPLDPTGDSHRFHVNNASFSYGCAASTHCILRHFKSRQVVEIGSGNSSLVIAAALLLNAEGPSASGAEYTVVDPYSRQIIKEGLPGLTQLVKQRVELLDVGFFERLGENDVLFIDSGHVVRIGGDVNYLILDVLPRLAPGVIVHFHDIGLPYEYPSVYATDPTFRVFWTESYLVQAFLCFNRQFEVLLAMSYLMTEWKDVFRAAFPLHDPGVHLLGSGSFWIRRVAG